MTPSTLTAGTPSYTHDSIDACEEAAQRINVVIQMLEEHTHSCVRSAADDTPDGTGGYELSIMRDTLESIRNMLRQSAEHMPAPGPVGG